MGDFDAIVMSAVYEHLLPAERKALLPELWRHLRPGGFLFIFQTPYRFFPLESHTTRLPFINYLPDRLTHRIVGLVSHRVGRGETWPDMLRRGIRGATDREILAILQSVPPPPILLEPSRLGLKDRIDLCVALSGSARLPALKRAAAFPIRCIRAATGHVCTPFISLALKKPQE
ncbi:MAG: class I SAM-dependent methyltransferase [Candidatus Eisenbacteria bacterium]|nr:class I SAM-dependent methyltransferase [Candidatus Eisenbacteria bacterium]